MAGDAGFVGRKSRVVGGLVDRQKGHGSAGGRDVVMRPPFETSDGTVMVERRRRDGIGVLPPAVSPEQRRKRQRSNRLLAFVLILAGGFISGGSLTLVEHRMDPVLPLGLILGVVVLGQGVALAGRQERRGRKHNPEASPPKGRRRDDRRLSR